MIRFRWFVDEDGYLSETNAFNEVNIYPIGGAKREYYPLQDVPMLHRIFADTPQNIEGMIAFVREYGCLGFDVEVGAEPKENFLEGLDLFLDYQALVRDVVLVLDGKSDDSRSIVIERFNRTSFSPLFTIEISLSPNGPEHFFKPCSLASAIGLMLADEITNNRKYNQCAVCRKWFLVGPSPRGAGAVRLPRSDSKTCSDPCRSKLYRDRIKGIVK